MIPRVKPEGMLFGKPDSTLGSCSSAGRPRHGDRAGRFGRNLGGEAAQDVPEHRTPRCSDNNLIDIVGAREFQDGVCRINSFEHVNAETMGVELERLGPVPQRDQPVDAFVMPLLIERGIKGDAREIEHVQTSEPRGRQRRQNARAGGAKRVVGFARCFGEIDRDRNDRRRRKMRGGRGVLSDFFRSLLKRLRSTVVHGSRCNRSDLLVSFT
jgi:hypothetical protein